MCSWLFRKPQVAVIKAGSANDSLNLLPFCEVEDVQRSMYLNGNEMGNVHSDCLPEILLTDTSSTAQGGGGSFKNRKRIGEIDCCE